jgi:mono/diheme cytochrome c family protein
VTEIPDHLLQRSRQRRAALGEGDGGGGDEGGATPAASGAEPAASAPAASASTEVAPAAAPAAASAPAVIDEPPSPILLADQAVRRSRIPVWAAPVLLILPFWAVLYAGAFGERGNEGPVDPLVLGAQVYKSAGCSSCHGPAGEGVTGPALARGQAKLTFPNEADHIKWVREGSQAKNIGDPYGDPNREGGQHKVQSKGMPPFSGTLSQTQIEAVVKYEREKL